MKKVVYTLIGLLVGISLLYFLFRATSWEDLKESLSHVHWGWLALSQIPIWLGFFTRILRWRYIVHAVKPVSFRHMFSATQIGFLANFTLPGRIGELVRAVVLGRLAGLPVTRGLALVTLDRVTDLFGLLAVMVVALAAFKPSGNIEIPRELFGTQEPIMIQAVLIQRSAFGMLGLLVVVIGLLTVLYLNQAFFLKATRAVLGVVSTKLADKITEHLQHFAEGLHVLGSGGDMVKSIGWSLVTWATFLVATMCILEAFNIDYPWYTPFLLQAALAVFISVPGAPGFIGQFQVPLVAGLKMTIPSISFADAFAFSIVAYLVNVLPIILTGAFCLYREGLSFVELEKESVKVKESTA